MHLLLYTLQFLDEPHEKIIDVKDEISRKGNFFIMT